MSYYYFRSLILFIKYCHRLRFFLKQLAATKKWYRNYFIKVTYKNQTIKRVRLSPQDKNIVKQNAKRFNQILKNDQNINSHLKNESKF